MLRFVEQPEPASLGAPAWHRGRGVAANPANRFQGAVQRWADDLDPAEEPAPTTRFLDDDTRSALSRNDSPDLPYTWGLNPYRGCEHGCSYCYARPYHEHLGLSAGLDFETTILAKRRLPELLRRELERPAWRGEPVHLSGVTDCYQPVERRLGLTRACLEVLAEFRNPVGLITKNALIARDAELLAGLARHRAAAACLSITTLDPALARELEPRASAPAARLAAIRALAAAGVPVGVNIAPVIPGLNDHEIPAILAAAAAHGAGHAGFQLVRLPHGVGNLFDAWLERHAPSHRGKVLARIADAHGGGLDDPCFGRRLSGCGPIAQQIAGLFAVARRRAGLAEDWPALDSTAFRRPGEGRQLSLFDDPGLGTR